MIPKSIKVKNKKLPETPGVYLMKDGKGKLLYVGKAGNLSRRVTSYFTRPHDYRIQKLVSEIREIDYRDTGTAIEALILESSLIKRHMPPFNIREKDDTSFLYIEISTHDEDGKKFTFPCVSTVRGKDAPRGKRFGPFTASSQAREALKIIRRIFPFSTHKVAGDKRQVTSHARPCFDYQIGLCPGNCANLISREEYTKNIRNITLFLEGKKERIIKQLERDMKSASKAQEFEQAERLKRQLFALQHIQDVALIHDSSDPTITDNPRPTGSSFGQVSPITSFRIEGYDISNISGDSAVGSMVVFVNGVPDKNEYRKFRIKTVTGSNDVAMMSEVMTRRLKNSWDLPQLILVDGGLPQARAVNRVVRSFRLRIPVIGLAKGPERKRNDVIGAIPKETNLATLIKVRDESHRFAISYHKKLRSAKFLN